MNFPKFHMSTHFSMFIKLYGRLENLDTESLEQFHHFSAQILYDKFIEGEGQSHPEGLLFVCLSLL